MRLKGYLTALIALLIGVFSVGSALATDKVNVYLFWGEGCPHCEKEKEFLREFQKQNPNIVLHDFEVWHNSKSNKKFQEALKTLDVKGSGVPLLVIGNKYLVGYPNDEKNAVLWKAEIQRMVDEYMNNGCIDVLSDENVDLETSSEESECNEATDNPLVLLPRVGNINLEKLSLPALTIVLGFLDGFNPCAMWVLLFLISLLLGMEDRKKMWVLGIVFILTSALVYMLFMVAWLNLFLFVGYVFWIRAVIALIALVGGYSSLKKFWSKDSSGCDVVGEEKRKSVFDKLGKVTSSKSFLMAILGIMALAFAVNLVELVCSAGIPAVYTQVLALNNLGKVQYYLYIFLYILFFMLDDLFVFFVAMITLHLTGITTKYVKWSRLIGGILMIIIGILLLFRPEILMFG